jgi:hypothetical protein
MFPQGLAAPLKLLSQLLQAQPLCAQLLQALLALLRQLRRGLQPRTAHHGGFANSPDLTGGFSMATHYPHASFLALFNDLKIPKHKSI